MPKKKEVLGIGFWKACVGIHASISIPKKERLLSFYIVSTHGDAVHTYVKGARSERELLNRFYSHGYSVLRSAGSGVNSLGPDIIAIKDRNCLAFECKAWEKSRLSIDHEGFEKLLKWKENTKFPTYVAWRMNKIGWYFIELEEMKKGEKDYSITKKKTLEIGRDWMKLGIACEKEVSGSGEKQNGLKERSAESAEAIRNNAGEKAKLELDGILLESITESSIAEV